MFKGQRGNRARKIAARVEHLWHNDHNRSVGQCTLRARLRNRKPQSATWHELCPVKDPLHDRHAKSVLFIFYPPRSSATATPLSQHLAHFLYFSHNLGACFHLNMRNVKCFKTNCKAGTFYDYVTIKVWLGRSGGRLWLTRPRRMSDYCEPCQRCSRV